MNIQDSNSIPLQLISATPIMPPHPLPHLLPFLSRRFSRLSSFTTTTTTSSTSSKPTPPHLPSRTYKTIPLTLLLYSPFLIFLTDNVLSLSWVRGRSMSPTLSPYYPPSSSSLGFSNSQRDCILTWKWRVRESHPPLKRGEVVVFRHPYEPERGVVKRVVGVEGDLVRVRVDGRGEKRRRSGEAGKMGIGPGEMEVETREHGLKDVVAGWEFAGHGPGHGHGNVGARGGIIEVPKGHIWVEGDETFHSRDSNDYGPIPKGLVLGRVKCIIWPPSRIGFIDSTPIEERGGRKAVVVKAEDRNWEGPVPVL